MADLQPLQPFEQNLPPSRSRPTQKASGSRVSASRQADLSDVAPASATAVAVQSDQSQQPPQSMSPQATATQHDNQHSLPAAAVAMGAATAVEGGVHLPGRSTEARLQQLNTFKRQKRRLAEGEPDQPVAPQQPQTADPQLQQPLPQRTPKAAVTEEAGCASEPKVDPYDFHSSGSQPSGAQATLVAYPAARAAGTGSAAGSNVGVAAAPAKRSSGDAHLPPGAARTAKRPRDPAAEQRRSTEPVMSGSASQMSGLSSRRIPGRLVPWSCSACTFENPVSDSCLRLACAVAIAFDAQGKTMSVRTLRGVMSEESSILEAEAQNGGNAEQSTRFFSGERAGVQHVQHGETKAAAAGRGACGTTAFQWQASFSHQAEAPNGAAAQAANVSRALGTAALPKPGHFCRSACSICSL